MKLSIFTDELGIDLQESAGTLADWGLRFVDLRNRVFGKPAERLDDGEIKQLKQLLDDHGLKVACLETSLAKVHLPDDQRRKEEQEKLENIIRVADALDCHLMRGFFFWQPKHGGYEDLIGELAVRSDELQKVMDASGPLFERAREAGMKVGFENCGVTVDEVYAVLNEINDPDHFGLAWDPANEYAVGQQPSDEQITERINRSHIMHVKAIGAVPGLIDIEVPWQMLLSKAAEQGYAGPVSIETHNPDKSVTKQDQSERLVQVIKDAWPGGDPAPAKLKATEIDFAPVRFVVVGMGKGRNCARAMNSTAGTELAGVVDLNEELAAKVGSDLGVPYTTDLQPWLDDASVDAIYVVTPTGLHAKIACMALEAGKHVITTKPMEASTEQCDLMIEAADKAGKLLAVDFEFRFRDEVRRRRHAVEGGLLGDLIGGSSTLRIKRTDDYFKHNGGWRGTKQFDGGGVMSNQAVHHIDELIYTLGLPKRVSLRTWTQTHEIEAEDYGCGMWEFENGAIVQLQATSSYTAPTWYNTLELWGSKGAVSTMGGGPFTTKIERWFLDGEWQNRQPETPELRWANSGQNFAAAIRKGEAIICDGRDGRRSRAVIDAMYESAAEDGRWVDVAQAATPATA